MKPGVELLVDEPGRGAPVEKKVFYDFHLRMWLSHGDPIRWSRPWGLYDRGTIVGPAIWLNEIESSPDGAARPPFTRPACDVTGEAPARGQPPASRGAWS